MQGSIERFLNVLETERGFSVNTIFAYRNDLAQFLAFLRGESVEEGGREIAASASDDSAAVSDLALLPRVQQWDQLPDQRRCHAGRPLGAHERAES